MKGLAKLIAFTVGMILLVTVCVEVIILYTVKAQVIAISGHVLEVSTEMAPLLLEDGVEDVAMVSSDTSSIFTEGLIDQYQDTCETYFSQNGQDIAFTRRSNAVFMGHTYDYVLSYIHTGIVDSETKIASLELYIELEDTLSGDKQINTVLTAEIYFSSDILKGTIGTNKLAGAIIYYDSLLYHIATER